MYAHTTLALDTQSDVQIRFRRATVVDATGSVEEKKNNGSTVTSDTRDLLDQPDRVEVRAMYNETSRYG
jgi:hypothetical protein